MDVFRGGVLVFLAVLVFTPTTGWRGHAQWWGCEPASAGAPSGSREAAPTDDRGGMYAAADRP